MRNPFFRVICNRGNFTRKMRNPFEFAKELLRYTRGELSKEDEKGIEQVLSEMEGGNELMEELKDKGRIEREIFIIEKFDPEKALNKVKKRVPRRRLGIKLWLQQHQLWWLQVFLIWVLLCQKLDMQNLSVAEKIEPGKAVVTRNGIWVKISFGYIIFHCS